MFDVWFDGQVGNEMSVGIGALLIPYHSASSPNQTIRRQGEGVLQC